MLDRLSLSSPSKSMPSDVGLPFTPHASTGKINVGRVCTVSFGHIRFAFLRAFAEMLYRIVIPAKVSFFVTWCT
jgi:hypothetical protein